MSIKDPQPYGTANTLGSGIDLNNLQSPGTYVQQLNVNATTALHYPSAIAGTLEVMLSNGITQRYTAYDSSGIWIRDFYSGGWGTWYQVYPPNVKQGDTSIWSFEGQGNSWSISGLNSASDQNYKLSGTCYLIPSSTSVAPYFDFNFNGDGTASHYKTQQNYGSGTTAAAAIATNNGGIVVGFSLAVNSTTEIVFDLNIIPNTYGYTRVMGTWSMFNVSTGATLYSGTILAVWNQSTAVTSINLGFGNSTTTSWLMGQLTTPANKYSFG